MFYYNAKKQQPSLSLNVTFSEFKLHTIYTSINIRLRAMYQLHNKNVLTEKLQKICFVN